MTNFFKEQWQKYKTRKTRAGIIIDFTLLALAIMLVNPYTRMPVKAFIIKLTSFAPKESENALVLSEDDYNWSYKGINGTIYNFANLKGKVIFLNYWATWCPPCVAELASVNKLYEEYGDKVEFVLLSNEEPSKIKDFLSKKGYNINSFINTHEAPEALNTISYPTSFILSKDGKVVLKKIGAAKWHSERVTKLLDKLIAEQ